MSLRVGLPLLALLLAGSGRAADSAAPQSLSIAAAANLVFAVKTLNIEFQKTDPGVRVTSMTGASGSLVAQIEHGAPFDVFLSADLDFPRALIRAGQADESSLATFALGRLVFWTTRPGLDVNDIAAVVRNPEVGKLAIANLRTAPYGRAAKAALEKLGVWNEAQPKLVFGENIAQTTEFVQTGNAAAGFVALSIVISPQLKAKGRWVEVPPDFYPPIEQGAVITRHGKINPAAARYIAFLHSPAARAVLEKYGYGLPVEAQARPPRL